MSVSVAVAKKTTGRTSFKRFLHREGTAFYGFIGFWLFGLLAFQLFPMVSAAVLSFTNFNGTDLPNTVFNGWKNYTDVFHDPLARNAMGLTMLYTALVVPLQLATALVLAMLLNRKIRGRGLYRTVFYLPTLIPLAATALIVKAFYEPNFGILNLLISIFRPGTAIDWIGRYGIYCLITMQLWTCGTIMVIFLAGLQGIPEELAEAAKIDGAGGWQLFKNITWPLLTPITYFQLMLGIINALQMWVQANILSSTVDNASFWNLKTALFVYPSYALNQMMMANRVGYSMALLCVLFLLVLILTQIIRKTSTLWVHYEVEQEGRK